MLEKSGKMGEIMTLNEDIVTKYFELNGYSVSRNLDGVDLVIFNPTTKDKAIVEVKGWHAETFSLSYFSPKSEIFDFIKPDVLKRVDDFLGTKKFRKILVVSKLSKNQKDICISLVKKMGVDEIIEFRGILDFLIEHADKRVNYSNNVMQMMRIFKIYYPEEKSLQRRINEFIKQ